MIFGKFVYLLTMLLVVAALAGALYSFPETVTDFVKYFRTPPGDRDSGKLVWLFIYLVITLLNITLGLYYWVYVREHT